MKKCLRILVGSYVYTTLVFRKYKCSMLSLPALHVFDAEFSDMMLWNDTRCQPPTLGPINEDMKLYLILLQEQILSYV